MLAVKTYPAEYVDACEAMLNAQLKTYRKLADAAGDEKAVSAFDALFFKHLVLVLDSYFMHRTRALEGKDGNALNEVRMLSASILNDAGVLAADKTIKYKPETSVSKLAIGDKIQLDEAQFRALAKAYFGEIRKKFG